MANQPTSKLLGITYQSMLINKIKKPQKSSLNFENQVFNFYFMVLGRLIELKGRWYNLPRLTTYS